MKGEILGAWPSWGFGSDGPGLTRVSCSKAYAEFSGYRAEIFSLWVWYRQAHIWLPVLLVGPRVMDFEN